MTNCGICGKATNIRITKWFQYDNGEQFRASVCANCADWHNTQTEKDSK